MHAVEIMAGRGRRAWWRVGLALALWAGGAAAADQVVLDIGPVRRAVAALAAAPGVRTGTLGFYVAPLAAADLPMVQRSARQSFITASTMKTMTTGVALEVLGPEFRYETRVEWGAATGDVVIRGAGDPSLGRGGWDDLFAEWLDGLRAAGVGEVRGRVLADETAWEARELPGGWAWLDIGNYYAPPLTPLAFHNNEFRLWYRLTGEPDEPAELYDVEPWPAGLRIVNHLRIGGLGTGDEAYVSGGPGAVQYAVHGTLAADAGKEFIRAALPDPAYFCVREFTEFLQRHGVPVHGEAATTRRLVAAGEPWAGASGRVVAVHRSAPLRDLLVPIHHRSLNLDCECLLRTLGGGRAAAGLAAIRDHLAQRALPLAGYEQTDGSGLSRTNMITPELLTRANAAVLNGAQGREFLDSWPVLRAPRRPGGALIQAKNGSIERVRAWTGHIECGDGRRYVFSLLVNNYDGDYARDVAPAVAAVIEAMSDW